MLRGGPSELGRVEADHLGFGETAEPETSSEVAPGTESLDPFPSIGLDSRQSSLFELLSDKGRLREEQQGSVPGC
jgi:hypothetical protein